MKKEKIIAIVLAAMLLAGTLTACSKNGTMEIMDPAAVTADFTEGTVIDMDLSWEMIPLTATPAVFDIPMPSAPRTSIRSNQKAEIDYSNAADGYVMARFLQNTTKQLRVIIAGPTQVQYQYRLNQNSQFEVFPLSDGNGSYTITVFEQIEGTRYSTANTLTLTVTLKDEFAPFLRPNQFVNFTKDSAVVTKAADLVKGVNDLTGKVSAIYNFVIGNITYDTDFANEVQRGMHSGYVPNVDSVLSKGKGICFDFAALMAAMLRSQSIPTRLVVGYAGTQYHAWIDVWSAETGWVNNIIQFNGKDWLLMDPTFASSATNTRQTEEVMRYIGDGTNYTARFLY